MFESAPGRRPAFWLWLVVTAFIVYGTTTPFRPVWRMAYAGAKFAGVSFNPLVSGAAGHRVSTADVVQNVLLFLPFGVLGCLALDRRRSLPSRVVIVTGLGAALSLLVETAQLFIVGRYASFADVFWDTSGALLGGVASTMVALSDPATAGWRRWGVATAPMFFPMAVAGVVTCLAAWDPFDPTLDVGTAWYKLMVLARNPWHVRALVDGATQFVRFALLVVLVTVWLRQAAVTSPTLKAVGWCAGLGLALEASQLLIDSRMPDLGDVCVAVGGGVTGGLLSRFSGDLRGRSWAGLVAAASVAALAVQSASPFGVSVVQVALAYFPVGVVAAWLMRERVSSAAAFVTAAGTAGAIHIPMEYLQSPIFDRAVAVAPALAALVGSLIGAGIGRRGWRLFSLQVAPLAENFVYPSDDL